MFYDFNRKTHGYAVFATVSGSYGEKMWVRIGRAYLELDRAWLAQQRALKRYPDAQVVDPRGHIVMPTAYLNYAA